MQKTEIPGLIINRWSPYSLSSEMIKEEILESVFRAAGMAPSANNEQPWLFIYTTRDKTSEFRDFLDFLVESNRVWAQYAFALAISFARLTSSYKGRPNRFALYDTGMAVGNLLIQATSLGIYVHQMGGFSVEKVREYFNLKDEVEPVAVLAIGYKGDGTKISPELRKRDEMRRPRKYQDEYAFRGKLPNAFMKL